MATSGVHRKGRQQGRARAWGERVVKMPTAELQGKHHHTFFDNFFTSEKLMQDLLADGIYICV